MQLTCRSCVRFPVGYWWDPLLVWMGLKGTPVCVVQVELFAAVCRGEGKQRVYEDKPS
jgi:hypothetical protein